MLFNLDDRSNLYPCTVPLMALALGIPYSRVNHIINSRDIRPQGAVGRTRIFDLEAFEEVSRHAELMKAHRWSVATGQLPDWVPGRGKESEPRDKAG